MRLWGTINSKSNSKCKLMILEKENIYSLYDLREKYLGWSERHKRSYVKKEYNKKNRRNINGLTKREQQKQDTIKAIKNLKNKGLKQIEIAKELNINKATVSKYLRL